MPTAPRSSTTWADGPARPIPTRPTTACAMPRTGRPSSSSDRCSVGTPVAGRIDRVRPRPILRPVPNARIRQRRQTFGALMVAVLAMLTWQFWPSAGKERAAPPTDGGDAGGHDVGDGTPSPKTDDENPIQHVIFLVKENRSFDHYFGSYPGAEGATEGGTIEDCAASSFEDGPVRDLEPAPVIMPHDLGHAFAPGLYAINGGKMNGFNCVSLGDDFLSYTQYSRDTLPVYWAYADRFVLADRFFTSMYGPTFPEHLYTIAAQSYGIVDNKTTTDHEGNYCDDPTEHTRRFPIETLSDADVQKIMGLEEHFLDSPANLFKIAAYWVDTRSCVNIKVLPDELQKANVSWKYYAMPDIWMNAMQAIKHVRFGPMWDNVQDPSTILSDLQKDQLPAVSWLIPPDGSPNEHPGAGV